MPTNCELRYGFVCGIDAGLEEMFSIMMDTRKLSGVPASSSAIAPKGFVRKVLVAAWVLAAAAGIGGVASAQTAVGSASGSLALASTGQGVPVAQVRSDAPVVYTVARGDTLWRIAGLYLNQPWRWPELWGMNRDTIRNPHLIYPGQVLHLDVRDGRARIGLGTASGRGGRAGAGNTVHLSPTVRAESLDAVPLPTVRRDLIQPFLVRPVVQSAENLEQLPVVLASTEERLVLGNGDSIYVRGTENLPLSGQSGTPQDFSIFREARPLQDPDSGEVLGYEGEYLGQARLAVGESWRDGVDKDGKAVQEYLPAKFDITRAVTEIRTGDRLSLITESAEYANFVPRVPPQGVSGKVLSIYADQAVNNAVSNQVVAINLGAQQGVEPGHVFQILKAGRLVRDPDSQKPAQVRLPDEANGVLLVFRVFDRVAYGLIMDVADGVSVGDKLVSPQPQ